MYASYPSFYYDKSLSYRVVFYGIKPWNCGTEKLTVSYISNLKDKQERYDNFLIFWIIESLTVKYQTFSFNLKMFFSKKNYFYELYFIIRSQKNDDIWWRLLSPITKARELVNSSVGPGRQIGDTDLLL